MKPTLAVGLGLGLLLGPLVAIVRADLSADEVRTAIDRGVSYLKQNQSPDGTWSEYPGQPGGVTALCTLALLNAGVDPQDEHVQLALADLRRRRPQQTYVAALITMVLCRAEPEKDQVLIGHHVEWLQKNQIPDGKRKGAWSYPFGSGDNSNSQFALLALYEADRLAESGRIQVRVERDTWELARHYWISCQNRDGSWGYYTPLPGSGSMTCAGISSLVIASDVVHRADAQVLGDRIDCCTRSVVEESEKVEAGIEWLRQNFSVELNPGGRVGLWHLYYLYALERVGRLTNRRFIGNHDWYREGVAQLLRQQDNLSGYWKSSTHAEENPDIATSLALLFMAKGRRPVLLAKIKNGREDDWNRRRNDVSNLTLYVEPRWKRELTWQVIDLEAASVDDLLQAPVLFFAGGKSPLPPGEERQLQLARKVRDYLDRGGFLLGEADCCSTGFDEGFRQLMKLVFPEREYGLKPLDPGHPIWHAEERVPPEQLRPLLGIDFGCRTSVVYAPRDADRPSLSCLWELSRPGREQKYSAPVQTQIDAGCALGINLLAYATNREVKFKYDVPETITGGKTRDQVRRGKLCVAKLEHPGGCDAAPRALANLMELAARELKIRAEVHPALLSITDDALMDYPMVFMHGRSNFRLTDRERARLKTYVERGGILFADAICASPAFTESFRREMAAIFAKTPLERIPAADPLWTAKYGGFELGSVTRRDPQPSSAGGPLKAVLRRVPPEMEGIKLGDRYGVIFSQFDLSCALEKHDSLECRGYVREDAAKIGINVLLYGVQQ
ncbi:MAG: DUF4159 domain-containing protein [Thermoguttaceae bacterium]|jgi:prenyltransferase beta subunit